MSPLNPMVKGSILTPRSTQKVINITSYHKARPHSLDQLSKLTTLDASTYSQLTVSQDSFGDGADTSLGTLGVDDVVGKVDPEATVDL